jgi:L-arabinokinase
MNPPHRIEEVGDQFASLARAGEFLSSPCPIYAAQAPGRLDFMGGNVDYTGGWVLQMPLKEGVSAAVQATSEPIFRMINRDAERFGWASRVAFPARDIASLEAIESFCRREPGAAWCRYVLGAFHFLRKRHGAFRSGGANLLLSADLPPNCGVASSAALELAILKAAAAASGFELVGIPLAQAGQWVENVVAHSACGIMDQAAIVLGQRNALLPLLCQPCTPLKPLPLPPGVRVWGIDSMVPRATIGTAYETARAAAFMAYSLICEHAGLAIRGYRGGCAPRLSDGRWNGSLSNLSQAEFASTFEAMLPETIRGEQFLRMCGDHHDPLTPIVPERLYPVRAAGRYATAENERVRHVMRLLEDLDPGDIRSAVVEIGRIQMQSHDAYRECGLGSAVCDELVAMAARLGFPGVKMTGGGAGGVVAVLGYDEQEPALQQLIREFAERRGAEPRVFRDSADGMDRTAVSIFHPKHLCFATNFTDREALPQYAELG